MAEISMKALTRARWSKLSLGNSKKIDCFKHLYKNSASRWIQILKLEPNPEKPDRTRLKMEVPGRHNRTKWALIKSSGDDFRHKLIFLFAMNLKRTNISRTIIKS